MTEIENVPVMPSEAPQPEQPKGNKISLTTVSIGVFLIILLFGIYVIFFFRGGIFTQKNTTVPVATGGFPSYVTSVYTQLSSIDLSTKQQTAQNAFGSSWNVTLDAYGYVDSLISSNSALLGNMNYTDIANNKLDPIFSQNEINFWNDFVQKHASFFGIDPTASISFVYTKSATNTLDFLQMQQYDNGQVIYSLDRTNTSIQIRKNFLTSNTSTTLQSISISGHFWPNFSVPTKATYDVGTLKSQLVGQSYSIPSQLTPCDPVPNIPCPQQKNGQTAVIKPEDLQIELIPYLYTTNNIKQGRLAYKVTLTTASYWLKLFDAITKEPIN